MQWLLHPALHCGQHHACPMIRTALHAKLFLDPNHDDIKKRCTKRVSERKARSARLASQHNRQFKSTDHIISDSRFLTHVSAFPDSLFLL